MADNLGRAEIPASGRAESRYIVPIDPVRCLLQPGMQQMITGRWDGKRSNGRTCTVTEVTEYGHSTVLMAAAPNSSYILVDHEPTQRLGKGRYQVLPCNEVVTCDHPDAP
jgi:hypothetical protein